MERVEDSDELLLERTARGDEQAFAILYDRWSPRVLALIVRVLVDVAQSEEVLQEVFLEVWRTADSFDASRGSARAWIAVMARRRAIDRVRSSQATRERDSRWVSTMPDADTTLHAIEDAVEAEELREALDRVGEPQRSTLLLAYIEGLSHSEISSRTGVPLGTVKTRLRDGLQRLRRYMGVER